MDGKKTTRKQDGRNAEAVNRVMGITEWVLIMILSILWGGSFFFVGVAVQEVPPLTIVWCRVALASLILLIAVRLKKEAMPSTPGIWGCYFIMGALNNLIPFSLIVWGQTHIASGLASILNATTPIFSVILTHLFSGPGHGRGHEYPAGDLFDPHQCHSAGIHGMRSSQMAL